MYTYKDTSCRCRTQAGGNKADIGSFQYFSEDDLQEQDCTLYELRPFFPCFLAHELKPAEFHVSPGKRPWDEVAVRYRKNGHVTRGKL